MTGESNRLSNFKNMKKLSFVLESLKEENVCNSINTVETFKAYVHEQLSSSDTYDKDTTEQLTESLLSENRNDIKLAMSGFKSFVNG